MQHFPVMKGVETQSSRATVLGENRFHGINRVTLTSFCVLSAGMPPPGFPPVPPPGTMPPTMPPSLAMPPNAGAPQGGGGLPPPPFPPGSMHPGQMKKWRTWPTYWCCVNCQWLWILCVLQVCLKWPCLLLLLLWCLHLLLHQDRLNQGHRRLLVCLLHPWACHPEHPMDLPWVRNRALGGETIREA